MAAGLAAGLTVTLAAGLAALLAEGLTRDLAADCARESFLANASNQGRIFLQFRNNLPPPPPLSEHAKSQKNDGQTGSCA